jgi:hypothetical protein
MGMSQQSQNTFDITFKALSKFNGKHQTTKP